MEKENTKYPLTKLIYDFRNEGSETHEATIYIRVTHQRKTRYFNTGVRVFSNQWKNGVIVRHPNADVLNKRIRRLLSHIESKISELWESNAFTLERLRSSLSQEATPDVTPADWIESAIKMRDLAEGTRKHHLGLVKELRKFGKFKSWADFTPASLAEFDQWLRENSSTSRTQATIYNYHKRLKTYLGIAVVQSLIPTNPYSRYKVSRGSVNRPRYLTEQERDKIAGLQGLSPMLDKARDLFIFMCYTGLGYSDMAKVRKGSIIDDGGRKYIEDTRTKTKGHYKIMLLPNAVEILEKYDYVLPIISNQKINESMKIVAVLAGVKKRVTCHVARHTFATWALRSGVRIEVVSKMLAHADIKTTQIYARVLQEEVDEGFALLAGR